MRKIISSFIPPKVNVVAEWPFQKAAEKKEEKKTRLLLPKNSQLTLLLQKRAY